MATKNNPGPFDCHAAAAPDEPMFVLLGRDPNAPALVRQWAMERSKMGADEQPKVMEALSVAADMERYRLDRAATPMPPVLPIGDES